MYDLLLKNGTIVDSNQIYQGNVYIKNEKIAAITDFHETLSAKAEVDVTGKILFPGFVDTHMHIGEYVAEFEEMDTATAAAVVGGVTCSIDMPLNLNSPSVVNREIFLEKKKHLEEKSYVDFAMWGALVPDNIEDLKELDLEGAISYKSFLPGAGTDFGAPDVATVRRALLKIKEFDGLAGFHCEDDSIIKKETAAMIKEKRNTRQDFLDSRPLVAELIATQNMIFLAKESGARVHICHVSHPEVAKLIETAIKDGVDVSAETCVHYLVCSEDDLLEKGCLFKCAPPLREAIAKEGMWKYLENGTLSCVASDHSPGMLSERDDTIKPIYEVGNGISGVQTMFQIYFDAAVKRNLPMTLLAKTLSAGPAKRFGLYEKKGEIKIGFDADIVVVDPDKEWIISEENLHYKQKISAFVGMRGTGIPVATYVRGQLIAEQGALMVKEGCGQFVTRNKNQRNSKNE